MSALLTPAEVAEAFGVNVKTVTRWAQAGMLPAQRTLGGHRRYSRTDVEALLTRDAGVGAPHITVERAVRDQQRG